MNSFKSFIIFFHQKKPSTVCDWYLYSCIPELYVYTHDKFHLDWKVRISESALLSYVSL